MTTSLTLQPLIFVASPFAGQGATADEIQADQARNIEFAERVCREIAERTGALPIAPHLLFPRFLDDQISSERELGIAYGKTIMHSARYAAFFVPSWRTEMSTGMKFEWQTAGDLGVLRAIAYAGELGGAPRSRTYAELMDKLALMFPKR